jgi:hypothetical protein
MSQAGHGTVRARPLCKSLRAKCHEFQLSGEVTGMHLLSAIF